MDRFGPQSLDVAMASVAVPGTDPEAVSEYVIGRLAARRRRSRVLAALAATLVVLAGGTAFALSGGEDPEEIVASADQDSDDPSGDSDSEVAEAGTGTVVTAVPTTVPTTVPATTTFPSIAGTNSNFPRVPSGRRSGGTATSPAPPPATGPGVTSPPPTTGATAPPDAPLTARFAPMPEGSAVVGEVVTVTLKWADPDLPAGTRASARLLGTGENGELAAVDGACTGGTGEKGTVTAKLRLAMAKVHAIAMEISTCGGASQTFATEIDVVERSDGQTAVKVRLPRSVDPERGTWTFVPEGGGVPTVLRADDNGNDPAVRRFEGDFSVTVVTVPGPGAIIHEADDCLREGTYAAGSQEVILEGCL